METELSQKSEEEVKCRIARLEATTDHLVADVRELRADFRMMMGLQIATLGMVVTLSLGTAALIVKAFGGV